MRIARSTGLAASLVLLALLGACSSSEAPPKPAALSATAGNNLTATVGTATSAAPAVKVTDEGGTPIANVPVTFAVTAGGGTLQRTSATTDAQGVASAGQWTLGTTAGANTATATAAGLSTVTFTATATAAAAASIAVTGGDNQQAAVGAALATAPAVTVKDQYGNAVAGAPVTFAVVSGGGVVTGATTATDASGIARVGGWTLGIANGAQQLRATSGTLSATISATATVPAGCTVINYALGATLPLNWEANDCTGTNTGRRYDRLRFTTTSQQQVDAIVTGPSGRTLQLLDVTRDLYVGLQPGTAFSPPTQNPMHLKYVLGPGTYEYQVFAPDANTTGAYSFATTTGTKVDCDYIVFGTVGTTIADSVVNTTYNCAGPGGFMEQWVNLQLKTGMKVRLTLTAQFPAAFLLRDDRLGPASPTLVRKDGTAGQTLVIDWTATFDSWHEIIVAPLNATGGKYTLKIEELP